VPAPTGERIDVKADRERDSSPTFLSARTQSNAAADSSRAIAVSIGTISRICTSSTETNERGARPFCSATGERESQRAFALASLADRTLAPPERFLSAFTNEYGSFGAGRKIGVIEPNGSTDQSFAFAVPERSVDALIIR